MLKRIPVVLIAAVLIAYCVFYLNGNDNKKNAKKTIYNDGEFTGESRSIYIYENYWGVVIIKILHDKIVNVSFDIFDRDNKIKFDENYEKRYVGNQEYIDQCRKDWNGVKNYPVEFLKVQDINNVDSVTGATWSYNIFKAALMEALKKAKKN